MRYLRIGDLVAASGGDPWAIDDSVQAGSPTQINFLAQAFHSAAGSTTAAEESFRAAQHHFEQYNRENGEQPINNGAQVQRVKEGLRATNAQLGQIAADLETIAAALAQTRQDCEQQIEALNANLLGYDQYLADYNTNYLAYALHGEDVDALIDQCWAGATADTRTALANVLEIRNRYSTKLQAALTSLRVKGGCDPNSMVRGFDVDQVPPGVAPDPQHAAQTGPVPLKPEDVESFTVLARQVLTNDGVPPDQIEERINAAVLRAQQPLPRNPAAEPQTQPAPGFGDGFGDRWRSTEQAVKNLLGQGGPGAPGVVESWGGLAKGLGNAFINPVGAGVEQVKDAINSPSPAYFLGEKAFDAGSAAVTLPFGAEGAEIRASMGEMGPVTGPVVSRYVEMGLDVPTTYHERAEQTATALNVAARNAGPTADLSEELAYMSTHYVGDNPDRVVLGRYDGQDGGYIGEARAHGGIFFDTGHSVWSAVIRGLEETQQRGLTWQLNENFLRNLMEEGVARIDYGLPAQFSRLEEILTFDSKSYSAQEIAFLQDMAGSYGYQRSGNSWVHMKGGQ